MKWSELLIARAISRQVLQRKCVVLVDNCNWTGHEADVLGVTMDGRLIDVEVKISRADLKADAAKDKWWQRVVGWRAYGPDAPREHPPRVWKHYYAMPADVWRPELVECLPSAASGVLLLRQRGGAMPVDVQCVRRATPAKDAYRLTPAQTLDVARLANLRMWEAYRRLEAEAAA